MTADRREQAPPAAAPKAPEAFRTISEVSDILETPPHVLRFWESKFTQLKPVKRAGGRRYYRPADLALLGGIKRLLHDEGMTIRGVQKMLREHGARHVAALAAKDAAPTHALDVTEAAPEDGREQPTADVAAAAEARPADAAAQPTVEAAPADTAPPERLPEAGGEPALPQPEQAADSTAGGPEAGAEAPAADEADAGPEATADLAPEATADPAPEASADPAPEASADPAPEATGDPAPEATGDPAPRMPAEPTDAALSPAAPAVADAPLLARLPEADDPGDGRRLATRLRDLDAPANAAQAAALRAIEARVAALHARLREAAEAARR